MASLGNGRSWAVNGFLNMEVGKWKRLGSEWIFKYGGWEVEEVGGVGICVRKLSWTWKWKTLKSEGGFKYTGWKVKGF